MAERGYQFGPVLTDRIISVVKRVDGSAYGTRRIARPTRFEDFGGGGNPVRLGKTTAAWNKGTTATITLYEEGTPPSETTKTPTADTLAGCVNKFANVASGKWVMVARAGNGYWYLIAAEC